MKKSWYNKDKSAYGRFTKMRIFTMILTLFLITGCMNDTAEDKTIYVAAASDLYHALTEMGEEFAAETSINIEFTFGSTGLLTQQIKEGAPFDLFAAAHEMYIEELLNSDSVLADSKEYYAIGRIVLMGSDEEGSLKEKLLSSNIRTITIANPEHAPYGKAAKEALQSLGIWEEVEHKIVYAENIRQAYQYVESGNADVGIVALALVTGTQYPYEVIDEEYHQPILQALGIPSQTEKEEMSKQFVQFIVGPRGQAILKEYGFDIP
ncbi:molybdate ABC transporter substrate-binding protein [Sutcliffiella cohnii]|nr:MULTISPECIES: molybdate ABC transporter substrate-binding protein [Sutcliffiella]WBL17124.1 molybdate ABC transporter substrate-binding protein [Sutcliffiella sp. NC1]